MSDYTEYRSPLGDAAQEIARHVLESLGCEYYNAGCENKLCSKDFQEKLKGKHKNTSTYRHIRFILDLIVMMRGGILLKLEIKGSLNKIFTIAKTAYDTYMEKIDAANLLKKHGMKHDPRSLIAFVAPDNVYVQYIHKLKFQEASEKFWSNSLSKYISLGVIDKYWNNPYSLSNELQNEYKEKTHSSGNVFARIDKKASNFKKLIRSENVAEYQKFYQETMKKYKVPLNEKTLSKLTTK